MCQFLIIQTPGLTVILFEIVTDVRRIFTDGRSHPTDRNPTWFGYSVGRFDGDTFVVATLGFNGKTWLDDGGHPLSEFTFDDPKTYTKPWSVTVPFELPPDTEIIGNVCENELDQQRLKGIRP